MTRSFFPLTFAALLTPGLFAQQIQTHPAVSSGRIEYKGCYATWGSNELVTGNTRFDRKWTVQDGRLTSVSFRTKNPNFEWLVVPQPREVSTNGHLTVAASTGRFRAVEAGCLRLEVTISDNKMLHYDLRLFPEVSGVLISEEPETNDADSHRTSSDGDAPIGTESENTSSASRRRRSNIITTEDFTLAPAHLRLTQVNLVDQTDVHNELVWEREWLLVPSERTIQLSNVLIFVEDPLSGSGLAFLRLAPLPHARPDGKAAVDFVVNPGSKRVQAAAVDYPVVSLAYHGGRVGRIAALQTFQRQLRVPDPSRDGIFLSNTWGDRSKDARINESFILQEIEAGARLGVDVVEIDDGWMKGHTANSVRGGKAWGNWWAVDPLFWAPDPTRFPNGLEPIIRATRDKGLRIGLWFSPDASNGATNWQRDANRVLELFRDYGVEFIKIDGLDTKGAIAAVNERRLFNEVLEQSEGKVVFDLDVTAGSRPGYFGMPEIGPIFLENRYTDWHRYWPHLTLRNLWELAKYVDPIRLRIEFLNHTRNPDQYRDDPLAPVRYQPDTLFATTMFASPLGWFEMSNLPDDYIVKVAPLVATWKRERARLHGGTIVPIGDTPDGAVWTGFASIAAGNSGGYVLLFRELNKDPEFTLDLHELFRGNLNVTRLGGRGVAEIKDGRLSVSIPAPLDFLWVRLDASDADRKR